MNFEQKKKKYVKKISENLKKKKKNAFFLVKIPKWRGIHEFDAKTESRNIGDHKF